MSHNTVITKHPDTGDARRFPVLTVLILITGLALAAFGWYALSNWLRADDDITWYPPATECNLHRSACTASLGEHGSVSLSVPTSGRIQALTPLPLNVSVSGLEARGATVDFVGRGMDMGLNRFVLEADGRGHFSGQGQVGVCTQDVMPWRAHVILETPEGRVGSWFDFDVVRS